MATREWRIENSEKLKAYRRTYYSKNVTTEKNRINNRKKAIHDWFKEYKSTLKCEECGEDRWQTIDFHHKNPLEKEIGISVAIKNGWSKSRILNEIEKCEILCANCHRMRHI